MSITSFSFPVLVQNAEKKNEETNDFYRKEKDFRKFSCYLRNMNHATYRYATKKIVYLYILTILLPVQRDRLGLAEQ